MDDDEPRRYLIIVQFAHDTSISELTKRVPGLQGFISSLSNGEMELVFRSPEGLTFGMFFKSKKPIGIIRSVLDGATSGRDSFFVVEVGTIFTDKGFSRPTTWLQRH